MTLHRFEAGRTRLLQAALCLALGTSTANAQTYTRTDDTTYENNKAAWVIGQVKREVNVETNIETTRTDYDPTTALPIRFYHNDTLPAQTVTYNADGTIASVSDGRDGASFDTTVVFEDWKRGIPQTIRFPDGKTRTAKVDDFGLIRWVTDENNGRTCYDFDPMGRLSKITYPHEGVDLTCDTNNWNTTDIGFQQSLSTEAEYGIAGSHWRQIITTGNGTKAVYFDAFWRPLVETSYDAASAGATMTQVVKRYDEDSHVVFQSYPAQGVTNFASVTQGVRTTYDALGRPIRSDQDSELGVLSTLTEYLTGFKTRTTTPRGFQTTTSFLTYDQPSSDWPIEITHPEGATTQITRDLLGKPIVLKRRDAADVVSASRYYVYDHQQRLCKSIEPETGTTVMGYDVIGNVLWSAAGLSLAGLDSTQCEGADRTSALASGRAVQRTYDTRNRLSTLVFPDHAGDQTWTYTPDGLADQIVTRNADGAIAINAYHYNARRMLNGQGETIQQQGWYTWGFGDGYDRNGNVTTHVYPGGETVAYAPNALGQPTQVTSAYANYATGISYFPNGALKQFTYGNGIVHTMQQNMRQLPDRSKDDYAGTSVLDDSYTYDGNGNVAAISDGLPGARGNRTMGYDGLDRLTSTVSPMFGTASYSYDVLDNLTHVAIGGTKARDQYYCYDTRWQLTNIKTGSCASGPSVIGLGYDVQGNLQNKNGRTFNFDYGNRLDAIVDAGATLEAYRYDGHGRRILQWNPSGNILSMYGQDGVLRYQENGRTGKATNYIYLSGSLVATQTQPTTWVNSHTINYQHTDALGTPVAVTDVARNVTERSEYEPFGQLLNRPLTDGPGYTGHVSDALSGLTYMQQRYYDPAIGRFLSVDPIAAYTKRGISFNRYWYANDNTYRFTDPDGRYTCDGGSDKDFCAKVDSYVSSLKDSRRGLRAGGAAKKEEYERVTAALAQIGEKGKGGPNYVPGTVAARASAHTDQNGTTTIQTSKIANSQLGAQNIAHEAAHDIDVKNGGPKTTEAQVRETETNAYSTSRAVDMGFGKYWTQSVFDGAVDASVQFWKDNLPKKEGEK